MKNLFHIAVLLWAFLAGTVNAQEVDSLEATVFIGRNQANYLSKGKELRTEVISSAGLMKMACCNLAESFENSASVSVDYADATMRIYFLQGNNGAFYISNFENL